MEFSIDISFISSTFVTLMQFLPVTILITGISILGGMLLGLILAIGQLSQNKTVNVISIGFVALMRGTPMLLLILLVYYGLPTLLMQFGVDINDAAPSFFAIFAISINSAAYFSETMRSSYLAVSKGQMEAGLSMGIPVRIIVRRIIIPQAAVTALPNMQNQVVSVLKHSSLVYAIGITDIYQKAQMIAGSTYGLKQLEVFIAVTLMYWLLCILVEGAFGLVERRLAYCIAAE